MWRLTKRPDAESGAVAVIVAVFMVVLLGFAAISIDVAKVYSERAQLQNGADAAALLVAQKCAKHAAGPDCSTSSSGAAAAANGNAVDGATNVHSITLDTSARTVQVVTGAREEGAGSNSVSMSFAGVLGFPTAEVGALAAAGWGSPKAG